jgi:hypothetical protein
MSASSGSASPFAIHNDQALIFKVSPDGSPLKPVLDKQF